MLEDHGGDGDDPADQQGRNRHQQSAQAGYEFEEVVHRFPVFDGRLASTFRGRGRPRHTGNLVELTGIEPVASWLQTRRSPS